MLLPWLHREDKEAIAAEHEGTVGALRQQMRQALEEAGMRYAELEGRYAEVRAKYDARAPRDEDMARIRQVGVGVAARAGGQGCCWVVGTLVQSRSEAEREGDALLGCNSHPCLGIRLPFFSNCPPWVSST